MRIIVEKMKYHMKRNSSAVEYSIKKLQLKQFSGIDIEEME